jgi:hypothetical protein
VPPDGQRIVFADVLSSLVFLCGVPSDVLTWSPLFNSNADTSLTEYYLASPYNFYVSPKSAEGVDLKLDRVFSFSSSACDFLTKNNFSFGKVFSDGVPYMSRDEEYECREEFNQRADKKAKMENITIASDDSATLDFYRGIRRTITMWHKTRKVCPCTSTMKILAYPQQPKADFVNISHPDGNLVALNGFQRRLVYQLVRNEFPTLQAQARKDGTFMQITEVDDEKEAQVTHSDHQEQVPKAFLTFCSINLGSSVDSTTRLRSKKVCSLSQYWYLLLTNHRLEMDLRGFGWW